MAIFLFTGCKDKQEGGEQPKTEPAAAEPQKQPDKAEAPKETPAEAVPDAGGEAEPKPIVRHRTIEMPDVKPEEMNASSFPKKVTPQARKAIIMLRKLQQTDPRFKKKTGVPPAPRIEEHGNRKGKKKPKKRKK
jgi:hypothetical protein